MTFIPTILPPHPIFPRLVNGASPLRNALPPHWPGKLLFLLWKPSQIFPLLKACSCCSSKDNWWLPLLSALWYIAQSTLPGKQNHLSTFWLISKWINKWSARIQTTEVNQSTAIRFLPCIRHCAPAFSWNHISQKMSWRRRVGENLENENPCSFSCTPNNPQTIWIEPN